MKKTERTLQHHLVGLSCVSGTLLAIALCLSQAAPVIAQAPSAKGQEESVEVFGGGAARHRVLSQMVW